MKLQLALSKGTHESEVYMSTHKPQLIEECLQQIQEALDESPDRDDGELLSSDLEFGIEEMHEDVRDLEGEVAEVKDKVDDLEREDR
jgi:hypothetical protein